MGRLFHTVGTATISKDCWCSINSQSHTIGGNTRIRFKRFRTKNAKIPKNTWIARISSFLQFIHWIKCSCDSFIESNTPMVWIGCFCSIYWFFWGHLQCFPIKYYFSKELSLITTCLRTSDQCALYKRSRREEGISLKIMWGTLN